MKGKYGLKAAERMSCTACRGDGHSQSGLRSLGFAGFGKGFSKMPPVVDPVRIVLDRPHQERQVPIMLGGLIRLVTEVLDGDIGLSDRQAIGSADGNDARKDLLVYAATEPDPWIGSKKPELIVRRIAELRPKLQLERGTLTPRKQIGEPLPWWNREPLVGVNVKDPRTCGRIQREISCGGEIVAPFEPEDAGTACRSDLRRSIVRAGVDDHDLFNVLED